MRRTASRGVVGRRIGGPRRREAGESHVAYQSVGGAGEEGGRGS